jgi:integrase
LVQKWYSGFPTRRAAEAYRAQLLAAMRGGTYIPEDDTPLGDFLEQWLRDAVQTRVGPVTLRDYHSIVAAHLKPALGKDPLRGISAQDIDRYCAAKIREGLSPNTVLKHFRVLHAALEQAVRWGRLARNPADMATPPKAAPFEAHPWDEEETRLFLGQAKTSRHYPLFLTAILTGLRLGELAGLRWQDLDLVAGTASVRQTYYKLGAEPLFKPPKSRASQRTIALPASVIEALRAVREEQREARAFFGKDYQDYDLVFCQVNGRPLDRRSLARSFHTIVAKAGLRPIRFHDLRHGHASYLARAGVPVKVAQERLGHSSSALTLRVYTHVLAGQHEEAARAVEKRVLGRD